MVACVSAVQRSLRDEDGGAHPFRLRRDQEAEGDEEDDALRV